MSKKLTFASINDAIQYLSEYSNARIFIAALKPNVNDLVVVYHPVTQLYHVLKYPGDKSINFSKSDIVKDMRSKMKDGSKYIENPAYGEPMTFDGNTSPTEMAKEISNMIAGLSADNRKKIDVADMAGIYLADNLEQDKELAPTDLAFALSGHEDGEYKDRVYHAIGKSGVIRSEKRLIKDREEEEKNLSEAEKEKLLELLKKNPKRYKDVIKNKGGVKNLPNVDEVSKEELERIFASEVELICNLSCEEQEEGEKE